ncbi:uncharacterized protein [Musca autumnalis]|uniref:uncharacterized protein n=1 Tax=Musca autumnalis TaxID=221902 RepID=UPI003CF3BFCD
MSSDIPQSLQCRCCMQQDYYFYKFSDYIEETHRISDMLTAIVPQLQIKKAPLFSSLICTACSDKLLTSYKFQQLCLETDNYLRQHFGMANVKIEQPAQLEHDSTSSNLTGSKVNNVISIESLNFPCEDCGKTFKCMSRLRAHQTLHRKKSKIKDNTREGQENNATNKDQIENSYGQVGISEGSFNFNVETEPNPLDIMENCKEIKRKTCRKRKEELWKSNLLKKARNSGKAYFKRTPEIKVRSERKFKEPCTEMCKLQCTTKLTEEQRRHIFENFWNLGNLEKQRQYIANNTEPIQPKYRYIRENRKRKPRIMNNAFYFRIDGGDKRVRVCKLFFKNTLDINDRNISTVLEKKHKVADTILEEDKRGKHGNHIRLDEAVKDGIRTFIDNLLIRHGQPSASSNSSKYFLQSNMCISNIYREYVADCEQKNLGSTNYTIFYRIFKGEYNIGFLKKEAAKKRKGGASSSTSIASQNEALRHVVACVQNPIMGFLYD